MKSTAQRINIIIGQLEGIKKMIDSNKDCVQTLTQLKAIKSAVSGLMNNIVEEQFENCIKSIKDEDKKLLIKIKNYVKTS